MTPLDVQSMFDPWQPGLFSLTIFSLTVVVLIAVILLLTTYLGRRKPSVEKARAYESGIIPTGSARLHYPIPFFLVAVFFLIFDVEGTFIFTWAAIVKPLGWMGWLRMAFFIGVLLVGLIYIRCKEGLRWSAQANLQ